MESHMTEKERLMHALFGHAEREHQNIKFFRGTAEVVTPEQLCEQAANGIEQILTGLAESQRPRETIDVGYKERELSDIVASL